MATKGNIFAPFIGHEVKTATVKALNGAEIKYRSLTVKEADDFQKRIIKGFDSEGKAEFNFDMVGTLRNEKIALCLIEPKMTVKELEALSADAGKALAEIEGLITGTSEAVDEEGN